MEKLKIGIIGVGGISEVHIAGYLADERCELYAFCDINEKTLKAKGEKYGITRLFTDKDEMLAACPEIDAVSVCTWNSAHAECSIAALNAGKNVLCEKPMAMNTEQALAMEKAAKDNNKLLMIGFVRRFGTDCDVVKEFVDKGDFGDIYYAKASYLRRCGAPSGWFGDKARSGGGPMIDLGVHVIDLARYIAGGPKPVSVFGATFHKLGDRGHVKLQTTWISADMKRDAFDVEDFAAAMIRFDNGMVLNVETSFSLNIKKETATVELFGTKAGAVLDPEVEIFSENHGYLTNLTFNANTTFGDLADVFKRETSHFLTCILDPSVECRNPAKDGVLLMQILDAIYESARTGHEVTI